MTKVSRSLIGFAAWLPLHPVAGAEAHSELSVRHQVARYCNFLGNELSLQGNPLTDCDARDRAVTAYREYLAMFNSAAMSIRAILGCLDHFYVFLGLGPVREAPQQAS